MHFRRSADGLPDFERDQFADDEITRDERDGERGDGRRDRAKGDVSKDVERTDVVAQEMEVIHHVRTSAGARFSNSSSTASVFAARLPFTKTRSPGAAISVNNSAASAAVATLVDSARPAACAAREMPAPTSPIVIRRS